VIDGAAFDYAANAWGYTYDAVAEWYQGDWTARVGLFDLSVGPNSTALDPRVLPQYQLVAESERRYALVGAPGTARALVFALHGRMGAYDAATTRARTTGGPADIAAVREGHTKYGVALNVQQQFSSDAGAFVRASAQQGDREAFEFTDVARSVALGLSLAGARWQRAADTVGLALVGNQASAAARRYFAAGGLGILVGDGKLVHAGTEQIAEVYYRTALGKSTHVTVDYQVIGHPAYNRDRGPVSIVGLRIHAQQ
jgi:high affinity Mn2+ porin